MAYDEELAARLQALLADEPGLSEKRMFGGLAFLLDGKLTVAASGKGGLMVRVEPEETDSQLTEPGVHPFEMRGGPVDGWLRVDATAVDQDADLRRWVNRSVAYTRSLPAKG